MWLATGAVGAILFQTGPCTTANNAVGGFPRFYQNGVLSSVDFCYIFDCQGGFLGGAVQVCDPTDPNQDIFVDCPGFTTGTGTGTGTTP
jgi:hypothetical protein